MLFIGILVASVIWSLNYNIQGRKNLAKPQIILKKPIFNPIVENNNQIKNYLKWHDMPQLASPINQPLANTSIIESTYKNRITMIIMFYTVILSWNTIGLENNPLYLGNGIGIYNGLWQVTSLTASIDILIFLLAAITILLSESRLMWTTKSIKNNNEEIYKSNHTMALNESNQYIENTANLLYQKAGEQKGEINESEGPGSYTLIILFTTLGMTSLISSYDLISIFLGLELQSFGLYITATTYRESESSTSSGLKYFLLGALSSGFILLGCSIIYGVTGVTNWDSINQITTVAAAYESINDAYSYTISSTGFDNQLLGQAARGIELNQLKGLVELSLLIIGVGFLWKIAAAPFHNWAPDVYDGVPTLVTSWLAVTPKVSLLILMLEFGSVTGNSSLSSLSKDGLVYLADGRVNCWSWHGLFIISALLSLIVGSIIGLGQYRIKRLLAYSAISHVGFMLLALGINTEQSIESMIFYLIQYSLTSINVFFIIIAIGNILQLAQPDVPKYSPLNTISQLSALAFRNKEFNNNFNIQLNAINSQHGFNNTKYFKSFLFSGFKPGLILALCLAISLFSMAGIPPFIGFFAKLKVFYSAINSGYYILAIIAVLTSVISAAYYLRIIKVMFFNSNLVVNNPEQVKNLISNFNIAEGANSNISEFIKTQTFGLPYGISWIISLLTIFISISPICILTLRSIAITLF